MEGFSILGRDPPSQHHPIRPVSLAESPIERRPRIPLRVPPFFCAANPRSYCGASTPPTFRHWCHGTCGGRLSPCPATTVSPGIPVPHGNIAHTHRVPRYRATPHSRQCRIGVMPSPIMPRHPQSYPTMLALCTWAHRSAPGIRTPGIRKGRHAMHGGLGLAHPT